MGKKCRLCGGKLIQNRCEFCGLDNSVYDREEEKIYRRQREMEQAVSNGKTGQGRAETGGAFAGKTAAVEGERRGSAAPGLPRDFQTKLRGMSSARSGTTYRRTSGERKKRGGIIVVVVLFIMLAALIPALFQGGKAVLEGIFDGSGDTYADSVYEDDTYDYDYDPYEFVTRQIPDEGSSYEALIGSGVYQIGVHIPEGTYRIELWGGSGSVMLDDYDNIIFEYDSFGGEEEYGEVMEKDDVRMYNGAQLTVDGGVVIRILTSNAQPLVQEITENPNQETIILEEGSYVSGEAFSEGMYNICPENEEDLFLYVTVSYPNENTDYFYPEINTYEAGGERYEENGVKNVIFPSGTQIEVEGGTVMLEPSAEYYKINYDNYPAGY